VGRLFGDRKWIEAERHSSGQDGRAIFLAEAFHFLFSELHKLQAPAHLILRVCRGHRSSVLPVHAWCGSLFGNM
jgi:hypothetical protein